MRTGCRRPVLVLFGALAVMLLFAAGCSKESSADTQLTPEQMEQLDQNSGQAPAAPTYTGQTKPVTVSAEQDTSAILKQLNRELLKWMVQNQRAPASFEEFVASAKVNVPPPPAGKRYVIGSDKKIVLK